MEISTPLLPKSLLSPHTPRISSILQSLPSSDLDGFKSKLSQRFLLKTNSISYDQATKIRAKLDSRTSLKIKKNWKGDEVSLLLYLVDKCCLALSADLGDIDMEIWDQIGGLIDGREGVACRSKVFSLIPSSLNEQPWTEKEHQILTEIIEENGTMRWKLIAQKLFDSSPRGIFRTSKQCRERYMCFLQPCLKKGFWTQNEDYQLITHFLTFGRKWSHIAKLIAGRNENAIKNRFFLLFEDNQNKDRVYHSEFMRKVMRRKERLERCLNIKKEEPQSPSTPKTEEQFTEIEKFLCI